MDNPNICPICKIGILSIKTVEQIICSNCYFSCNKNDLELITVAINFTKTHVQRVKEADILFNDDAIYETDSCFNNWKIKHKETIEKWTILHKQIMLIF